MVGGIAWVAICLFGGYFFGNLPFVKENFSVVILAIIFISILPGVYEFVRHKMDKRRRAARRAGPRRRRKVGPPPFLWSDLTVAVIRRPARTTNLDLAVLQREVNMLLERLADFDRSSSGDGEWIPGVDVYECRGQAGDRGRGPGPRRRSRCASSFRDRQLVITGERRERRPPARRQLPVHGAPAGPLHAHRSPSTSRWTSSAPRRRLAGGVLTVTIPRLKDRRGREIVIPVQREESYMTDELRKDDEPVKIPEVLPVLPLRDIVIFPFMIVPLYVSRDRSIKAVDQALADNRMILLAAQKRQDDEDPGPDDIFSVGTVALIMRMLKLPDGRIRVLVQGIGRARILSFEEGHPHLQARIEPITEPEVDGQGTSRSRP